MPRPKRTKVASTAARVAKPPTAVEPPPSAQKQAKSRTRAVSKTVDIPSEDSDMLVVKSTRSRRRGPLSETRDEADVTMTGALPTASEEETSNLSSKTRTPPSRRTRTPRGSTQAPSSRKSSRTAAQKGSAQKDMSFVSVEEGESSGLGDHLLSFTSLGSDSPAHGTRPPSAIKVGATPAHERSILALTHFKRRPRQPSLLRMVQTTDLEDNDLEDNDGEDLDLYADDLEDFHPNAESTPLPKKQSTPGKEQATDSGVNLSSSSSRGTKRKLTPVVQVPRSSPPYDPPSGPDIESLSPTPSLPDIVKSTIEENNQDEDEGEDESEDQGEDQDQDQEPAQPEILSETMAPPMSSSDYAADEIQDPLSSPAAPKRRRRRGASANEDEGEAEEEQARPARPARGKQKSKPEKTISTAKLQAMLPKRRTRPTHEDSDASPIDSDEDELSMPPHRHARLARKMAAPKASKKPARAAKKSAAAAKAPRGSRTYGRRVSSDKENEGRAEAEESDEGDSGHTTLPVEKPSSNLAAMAKKFEDIDAFDLDFESVSYVQTSSSPGR